MKAEYFYEERLIVYKNLKYGFWVHDYVIIKIKSEKFASFEKIDNRIKKNQYSIKYLL